MRGGRDGPGGSGGNVRHGSLAVREQARARHKAAREESEKQKNANAIKDCVPLIDVVKVRVLEANDLTHMVEGRQTVFFFKAEFIFVMYCLLSSFVSFSLDLGYLVRDRWHAIGVSCFC